ncbi:PqqD family peptide modification chaperone [Phytoactinopolyspora alkaliphila]|uniref:PqqD family protein n=1 Tax=Phytoactinopolyspora alkaliphila TaxID=1783498 RepID=UPI001C201826
MTWREIDGEMVILDLSSSTYLRTNQTGSTLLRLLAEETSVDELADGLMAAYGIPAEQASTDVDAFLEMLREKNLLDTAGAR